MLEVYHFVKKTAHYANATGILTVKELITSMLFMFLADFDLHIGINFRQLMNMKMDYPYHLTILHQGLTLSLNLLFYIKNN